MGLDIVLFTAGVNFSAWSTILPVFLRHFTASNLLLSLFPAVRNLGLNLPPILTSPHIERLNHYRGFVLLWTLLERIPFLVLGLVTLAFGVRNPQLVIVVFFVCQLVICMGGGITGPAWLHLVSLAVPVRMRGRFFGLSTGVGGILGVGAAAITVELLRRLTFPSNFAVCFLATFAVLALSFGALAAMHEPLNQAPKPTGQAPTMLLYLRSLPAFLRRERNFSLFLAASVFGNVLMAIAPFVTDSASRSLHISDAEIGSYSLVLLAVTTAANIGLGWIGDRAGYIPVLVGGCLSGVAAMGAGLLGLATANGLVFYGVFALLGIYNSAFLLASLTIVTEFGTQEERPTFIALTSLVLAPVAIVMPLAGAVVADAFGYGGIFLGTGLCLCVAAALFVLTVRDPRQTAPA